MLTIFFDGQCPLCATEMKHLKQHDRDNLISLVDLHQPDFAAQYPEINREQALKILHASYQGQILLGLQVTHRAWTLVGKGRWVAPLNWPLIKPLSHYGYLFMAKYRHPISSFLAKVFRIKAENCSSGACYGKPTNPDHRRK